MVTIKSIYSATKMESLEDDLEIHKYNLWQPRFAVFRWNHS